MNFSSSILRFVNRNRALICVHDYSHFRRSADRVTRRSGHAMGSGVRYSDSLISLVAVDHSKGLRYGRFVDSGRPAVRRN
jgi:hypothetical protein